jgi:hypothetical protein
MISIRLANIRTEIVLNISYNTWGVYISSIVIWRICMTSAKVQLIMMVYFDTTKYLGVSVKYCLICLSKIPPVIANKIYITITKIIWCILIDSEVMIEMLSGSMIITTARDAIKAVFKLIMNPFTIFSSFFFLACGIWKVFRRYIEVLCRYYHL